MISLSLILSTFFVIFLAELPDKTALAALILATRFKARDVIVGAGLAFAIQTIVAVAAGSVLTLLPVMPIRIASGLGFLIFAVLSLRRKDEAIEEGAVVSAVGGRPPWVSSFLIIFAAEWGDLTQLATAALVAQSQKPLSIGIGAVLALWTVTLLAAYAGNKLGGVLRPQVLNLLSAILFAAIGLFIIYTAIL